MIIKNEKLRQKRSVNPIIWKQNGALSKLEINFGPSAGGHNEEGKV